MAQKQYKRLPIRADLALSSFVAAVELVGHNARPFTLTCHPLNSSTAKCIARELSDQPVEIVLTNTMGTHEWYVTGSNGESYGSKGP